ncbi:MAG: hypothetical protein IJ343_15375 [Clostridia bacterium]|nr:hypothetical protein [Clostridia bacterium]
MEMLLACRDGLLLHDGMWKRTDCPLRTPGLIAHSGDTLAVVDNAAHLLWHGQALPCPRDVEALALWQGYALILSSDTDSLSIADRDNWLVTARVGVCPQDMCLLQDSVLVCGGADGHVHRLSLPDLCLLQSYTVPGMAQRISAGDDEAHVLSALGDEEPYTLLGRLELQDGAYTQVTRLPGIPGAVHADRTGDVWAAAAERLYHFPAASTQADAAFRGFGLIRHIDVQGNTALLTDPVAGLCVSVTRPPKPAIRVLWRGDVEQACFR